MTCDRRAPGCNSLLCVNVWKRSATKRTRHAHPQGLPFVVSPEGTRLRGSTEPEAAGLGPEHGLGEPGASRGARTGLVPPPRSCPGRRPAHPAGTPLPPSGELTSRTAPRSPPRAAPAGPPSSRDPRRPRPSSGGRAPHATSRRSVRGVKV